MTLTLRIENYDTLENGGPTWITLDQRGGCIGRRAAMDWVLPDPAKHISGHHFDIAFRDGAYWLTDVSTNGTFLQGMRHRLEGPHRLQAGERLIVGHYILSVDISMPQAAPPQQAPYQNPQGWSGGAAADESDPWDFGSSSLNPVNPLPSRGANPHHLDDVAQDFVPLQRPTIPPGQHSLSLQQPNLGSPSPGMQQPPSMPQNDQTQVSLPPFVPPPSMQPGPKPAFTSVPTAQPEPPMAPQPQPVPIGAPPVPQAAPSDLGRAVIEAYCRGAGLNPQTNTAVDPVKLAEMLGQSTRHAADEIMRMLQDRANVKQFTRGGERTMRSATGNNPMKFLPDSDQALEAMFLNPRDGFMMGPDGFDNALKDLRLHQMAVFAALQPALAEVLRGLSPDEIEGRDSTSGNLLGGGKGKHWDTFVKRWDTKAQQGDHGMLDAFLEAFARAYMQASKSSSD